MNKSQEFLEIYRDQVWKALSTGVSVVLSNDNEEVVISFDANYRAFIPTNKGYNQKSDRIYLKDCQFIKDLSLFVHSERLNRNEMSGGRVFINTNGSFIKARDMSRIKIADLSIRI